MPTDRASVIARAEQLVREEFVPMADPPYASHLVRGLLSLLRDQEAQMARLEQEMRAAADNDRVSMNLLRYYVKSWANQIDFLRAAEATE